MLIFELSRKTSMARKNIFDLSTDIENFSNLMPKYFNSLRITETRNSEIFVNEDLSFLGTTLRVQTKHKILKPNIHEIHILSGPLAGSSFVEFYDEFDSGTKVKIKVFLKFNGFLKLLYVMKFFIIKKINKIMDEFIDCCELHQNTAA